MTESTENRSPRLGTREHAEMITKDRHPDVQAALQWLTFSHLPDQLQRYSRPFYQTAVEVIIEIKTDASELTAALNKMIEAKDSAVRAGIRDSEGRPGSVPRPQEVVDPPAFGQAQVPARPDQRILGLTSPNHDGPPIHKYDGEEA